MGSFNDNKMVVIGVLVVCLVMGSLVTETKAFDCIKVCHDACDDSRAAGKLPPGKLYQTCIDGCPQECAHFGGGPGNGHP
ncbi:hypothetical protein DCAR_0207049 [Daucus carota subsp. sativus]|uniref:Uncharacterized protein n=1 Tax=Daucus carota subsp. sativus TaxID=79200 RepID=A0A166DLX8_DAUCS|nr:hypothetical protein DCAR_0207049 [Daucus carota subsp. sativus]